MIFKPMVFKRSRDDWIKTWNVKKLFTCLPFVFFLGGGEFGGEKEVLFWGQLFCACHCASCFMHIFSFNP
jgi:hypothetical protein